MKKFFSEFREFLSRGNAMALAIGVIIGSAFTAIVTSLVDDIIGPVIGIIMGGVDFSGLSFTVAGAELKYGSFIQAVINFILTALVLFIILKAVNSAVKKATERKKKEEEEAEEEEPSVEVQLLTEIRDLLKNGDAPETAVKKAKEAVGKSS